MRIAENQLQHFRSRIDAVDQQLLDALERRVRLVIELWRLKEILKLPRRDEEREDQIVSRLASEPSGLLSEESIREFVQLVLWLSSEEAKRTLAGDEVRRHA